MTERATKCSACGADALGQFCQACGVSQVETQCPSCRTSLRAGARFCHLCGAPQGHRRRSVGNAPWIVAGITVVAAAIAVGAQLARGGSPPSPGARPAAVAPPLAPAPDISSMTPREQADRLFDRIMRARERGDEQEAGFFRPMAVQAYTALGALDVDARYHLGLIHAVTGDLVSARSQRDALLDTNPGHLLTILLEAEIARLEADTAALRGAYAQFLDRVDRELQTGKPEYRDHQPALDAFRDEARRTPGG